MAEKISAEKTVSARDAIMARVRKGLGVRGDEPGRRGVVQTRLRNPAPNLIPERAKGTKPELVKKFQTMLENGGTGVVRVRTYKGVPEAVAATLRERNLPSRVRLGTDPFFKIFEAEPGLLEILGGAADPADLVGLSHAFAGAAETGTLFLASGPDNPSTLNFLPEHHFVLIDAGDVFGSYEECWTKLRGIHGAGIMPRTVNLISGASRTADIEQTIVKGAHGPKTLVVFIVGSARE
ncbi:lactate utilization protein [Rhodomicrobium sp. Az07]|uniref:LutC/YkgG family protein n=1 Tax=Rhodomicrobium sp. Az07 TaxID=2839034 RepID=UPI002037507C|nr:lactate utilization protein [Rhodomicrobium sp. Az07]